MTYYGAKEIADSFRTVRRNTITIAEEIAEDKYGFSAAPETRTVAQTLCHLALTTSLPLQVHSIENRTALEGFDFMGFLTKLHADEQIPRTKQDIITMLTEGGEKFAKWMESVSDDFLAERVAMPPGMIPASKTRFEMLLGTKEHEMHHRGQLMLMERMLGMVPHLTRAMDARIAEMQANKASA